MRHFFSHRRSDPRWPGQDGRCEARRFHRDFGDGERGGRGPFGRHGHHGRGGRGGRFFESGDLRLVLLRLIAQRPRHGYELMEEIETRLGGAYRPSPGTIYPTLTLLEELGQIAVSATEGAKKLYAVTPEGERVLAGQKAEADALFARMEAAGGEAPAAGKLQILRAMHNLKLALRLRLGRGNLSEEQLRRIVEAIDATATRIERE
ncbi:Transcriptional regulator [Roseomonas mucosa]|mgnify:FL=1|jgi:DNA-binding PadR family transcriptional regulator|uniref:PadR family transcriptional regulator n=1 Tax=Roseomonas TaxID=125216 RepID=UPI0009669256|nr:MULTISPECIES: PadR family transcriptional regulator [Roseomonas]MDT8263180.1 PadR family transcriptional regulator [Roseomonas sp. DSM 102946]QDJ08446.1 Transcriptional regulator [Roseomonas mucosa]USQ70140.1 PadR family transcriptional regulator [Roseomonas mucosa]GAV35414.1 ranscriptional regulator YqjI [Roseomonas sp. TAS13]